MSLIPTIPQPGVSSAVSRALRSGRVWTIQGVGTLACGALAYACVRIGTENWWRLTSLAVPAICLVYIAAFIQRTALRVFRRDRMTAVRAGKRRYKVQHRKAKEWLPDAAVVFLLFVALVGWNAVMLQWLPDALLGYLEWFEAVLAWLLFIIFWLPLAAAALLGERSLWKPALRAWRRPGYWLGTLGCVVLCLLMFSGLNAPISLPEGETTLITVGIALLVLVYAISLGMWLIVLALVEESIAAPEPRSLEDTWD